MTHQTTLPHDTWRHPLIVCRAEETARIARGASHIYDGLLVGDLLKLGDVLKVRWYNKDSVGNPFRGSYYTAKVLEVNTNTDGHTVKYDDDESAIETNVKHGNTKSL